ncbi:unnamed protein product [Rotaria magnacalcarata]|uniref:Uncharacterized protein n=2 Tax=Rotaria magnacalcarata TaxID=392030 RepID=A0A816YU44_9BILA|nr:unnamed protein product [Rotaria magnacalcarata]
MLELWGYAFYALGFFPVILNQKHAESRTDFINISKIFSKFTTVNPAEYELSCYLRWVALHQQGGGFLMDYDILPMINPRSENMHTFRTCRWGRLTTYASMSPMVTHGNASEIEQWIQYMLNFKTADFIKISGKPHISDMYMAMHAIDHTRELFIVGSILPWFHYSDHTRHSMFSHINLSAPQIITRNQHIYHFLHHNVYLPISASLSPYSTLLVRSLTLCADIITPYNDLDNICTLNHKIHDICRYITINGFWSPNNAKIGKCTWKMGPPDNRDQWGIVDAPVREQEPFVVAVLPLPEIYRWRRWLNTASLILRNSTATALEFRTWASNQSTTLMLDELIPLSVDPLQNDERIDRAINAIRMGQALLITEEFFIQIYKKGGNEQLKRWIGARLGFFLTVSDLDLDSKHEKPIALDTKLFSGDRRFYSLVQNENQEWTKNWNYWQGNFQSNIIGMKT